MARMRRQGDYRRLLAYGLQDRRRWTFIALVTLAAAAATLVTPWPMKVLVDSVLRHSVGGHQRVMAPFSWLPGSGHVQVLLVYVVVATLLVFALSALLDVLSTVLWVRVGQGVVYRLARDVYAAVQRRSQRFHLTNGVGDTMQRVTGDPWCVNDVATTLLLSPLSSVLLVGGMVVLMARMSLSLTLVAVAVAPLLALSSLARGGSVRRAGELKRRVQGQLQAHLQQTLTGLPVVQAFGQEERHEERFVSLTRSALAAEQRSTVAMSVNQLASGTVTMLGQAAVLWFGAHQVLDGRLTIGQLLVFVAYLQSLQGSFKTFASAYATLQSVQPQIGRVMEVLEPEATLRDGPMTVRRARGHVRLDDVVFGYEPDRRVLDGVTIEARPGETVALVGATGAGKSTVANLLLRFYDPDSGHVLIDGLDVRDLTRSSLREQVALVSQESFLFPVSIAENIAFGRPGATRRDVVRAAEAAQADAFIRALPEGYDTVVGERGATLSGGQRQRVAIARALLKDAPILVLDEPTSALDAQTEHELVDAWERLMAGRTTVVIAHRLSTIRGADRIFVLDHGRVVESGNHDLLVALGGVYAHLYELQAGAASRTIVLPDARRDVVVVLPEATVGG